MKTTVRKLNRTNKNTALTPVEYTGLQEAFDHFNSTLFDGSVPDCFFTYQRKPGSAGSFAPDEFSGRADELVRDGIRLNPDVFVGQTDQQILQTFVFQMCRAWQWHHGKRSSPGYVNHELADKMKSIGLQPTSTGGVGGKETGSRIFHYVIPDGAFAHAYEKLVSDGWHLNLQSAPREGQEDRKKRNKTKWVCSICEQQVYGQPSNALYCSPCLELKLVELGIDVSLVADAKMRDKDAAPISVVPQAYELNPQADGDVRNPITQLDRNGHDGIKRNLSDDQQRMLAEIEADGKASIAEYAMRLNWTHKSGPNKRKVHALIGKLRSKKLIDGEPGAYAVMVK